MTENSDTHLISTAVLPTTMTEAIKTHPIRPGALKRKARRAQRIRDDPLYGAQVFIGENMVESHFGGILGSRFLPAHIIENMFTFSHTDVTSTSMKRLLGHLVVKNPISEDEVLARFIVDYAQKVFLTCIRCLDGKEDIFDAMVLFMDDGIDDSKLPIDLQTSDDLFSDMFGSTKAHSFWHDQYSFLAPVLSSKQIFYDFEGRVPLPFVLDTLVAPRTEEGTFGSVRRHVIHPAHFVDEIRQVIIIEPCPSTDNMLIH